MSDRADQKGASLSERAKLGLGVAIVVGSLVWSVISHLSVGMFETYGAFLTDAFSSSGEFLRDLPTLYGLIAGPVILGAAFLASLWEVLRGR